MVFQNRVTFYTYSSDCDSDDSDEAHSPVCNLCNTALYYFDICMREKTIIIIMRHKHLGILGHMRPPDRVG